MMQSRVPLPHPEVPVSVATVSGGTSDNVFYQAMKLLIRYDCAHCAHWFNAGDVDAISGPRIAASRTTVTNAFCEDPALEHVPWVLFVDDDMVPPPDALCRLLGYAYSNCADPTDPLADPGIKIIGGLCFAGHPDEALFGDANIYPTIYEPVDDPVTGSKGPKPVMDYPQDALVQCWGTGAAFLLVHRKVLLHMAQPHPVGFGTFPASDGAEPITNPQPWFTEGINKGRAWGEDLAFCNRAAALGYPTYVHTGVEIGHRKTVTVDSRFFRMAQERKRAGGVVPLNRAERRRMARKGA